MPRSVHAPGAHGDADASAADREVRRASALTGGNTALAVVVVLLLSMLVHGIAFNKRYGWHIVAHYLTSTDILWGLVKTLELTALAMSAGIVIGVVLAIMRLSRNRILSTIAWAYVWFFRGTPLLVQVIFWFNLSALYPRLSLGIPYGPEFISGNVNGFLTPFVAALAALGLHEAAYMAEIVRGGIGGVDGGQVHAARALGMKRGQTMRLVILPQALRLIVPPTGNRVISLLKDTALVSVIAMPELLYSAELIYSQNFQTIPLLMVACIWYLIVSSILMIVQRYLERRLSNGQRGIVS